MTQSELSPHQPSSTSPSSSNLSSSNQSSSNKRRLLRKPMLLLAATTLMTGAIAIAATPFNTSSRPWKEGTKENNAAPSVAQQTNLSSGSSTTKLITDDKAKAESTTPLNSLPNSSIPETRTLGLRETTEDGERVRIVAFEPDLDIYLHESTSDGIEVRTRSYLFGTSTDQIAVATTIEELREKYPEAFKLYKSYIDKAQPIPTSHYTRPFEEMPKLTGHGFLNSTLPISTMSLRESPATDKSPKTPMKNQKSTKGKSTKGKSEEKASVKKTANQSGRSLPADKKSAEVSRKSTDKKSSSATNGSSKKTPLKSAVSAKESGKVNSASSQTTGKGSGKAKSVTEVKSTKMSDKSRKPITSQGEAKGKTAAGSTSNGKSKSKVDRKSVSNDGKTKSPSQQNSSSKKIADKAATKTKRNKDMKSSSSGSKDTTKDQAKSVSFEKETSSADRVTSVAAESDGENNDMDSSRKLLKSAKQNDTENKDSARVTDGETELVPEVDVKVDTPRDDELLEKELDPSHMDMEMNCPATMEGLFREEMPDEYWDTRLLPQIQHRLDFASQPNALNCLHTCFDKTSLELDTVC
jgi:hypothetical protein